MMKISKIIWAGGLALCLCSACRPSPSQTKEDVLQIIDQVNTAWQAAHPNPGNAFWDNAAYHTGNMEAYFLTGNATYREYSEKWAAHNHWEGAASKNPQQWKYSYGETDEFVLFGDWQTCFQTYIDLYNLAPDSLKIARAIEVMEYQMATGKDDFWWWVDALYMAMPVMTKLYQVTSNPMYLDKQHQFWEYTHTIMYDAQEGLYFRDRRYVYPGHSTADGKKDFWSRGNGWAFAAFAKVISALPADNVYKNEYLAIYKRMAQALAACQQSQGYWTRSLIDPAFAPGPETSGTAFFTYAFFWGINQGILSKDIYLPTAMKGWQYLYQTALQPNWEVGYVQPIGDKAIPGQEVNAESTANFGVGAFLLAACEVVRYLDNQTSE